MKTLYAASKVKHAEMWRGLRAGGVPISSTWIDEVRDKESPSLPGLWVRCVSEAAAATATLVYADHYLMPETLKGALAEVGAALAAGKPVLAVGVTESDGSWLKHPLVKRFDTVAAALKHFEGM